MGAKLTHNRGLGKQWIMKRIKHKRTRESNKCSYAIQPKVEQKKGGFVVVKFFFSSAQQFWKSSCCGLVESRPPNYFRINGSRLRYAIDYFVAIAHFGNHIWCSEMPLSSDQIVSLIVPNFFPLRPTTFLNFVIHSTPHE